MRFLKPGFRFLKKRFLSVEIRQQTLKVWVGSNPLQLFSRYGLQYDPGIVRQFPEFRVELLPKPICRVVERPSKVQSQIGESLRNGCNAGMIRIHWSTHKQLLLMACRP